MFNNELMFRRGTLLNAFTRALRDQCQAKGVAEVRLRDGSVCKVAYVPAAGKHPYEDCAEGGFWGVESARYWMANGESDQGSQLDMLELPRPAAPAPASAKAAQLPAAH